MDICNISVTVSSQLNERDWIAINRTLMMQYRNKYRKYFLLLTVFFILVAAYFGYDWFEYYQKYELYFEDHSPVPYFLKQMLVPMILLIIIVALMIRVKIYPKRITRFMLQNPENSTLLDAHTITLSEEGIHAKRQYAHGFVAWPGIVKVIDTPSFFMFFMSSNQGYFIKKSSCCDSELRSMMSLTRQNFKGSIISFP